MYTQPTADAEIMRELESIDGSDAPPAPVTVTPEPEAEPEAETEREILPEPQPQPQPQPQPLAKPQGTEVPTGSEGDDPLLD